MTARRGSAFCITDPLSGEHRITAGHICLSPNMVGKRLIDHIMRRQNKMNCKLSQLNFSFTVMITAYKCFVYVYFDLDLPFQLMFRDTMLKFMVHYIYIYEYSELWI